MIVLAKNLLIFFKSIIIYKLKDETPYPGYHASRRIYEKTNGKFNDFLSFWQSIFSPKYKNLEANGVLGNLNKSDLAKIANGLNRDGYFLFDQKLPDHMIEKMTRFAEEEELDAVILPDDETQDSYTKKTVYDRSNIISPKYAALHDTVVKNETYLELVFDQSLLAVAQEYLQSKPRISILTFWWSVPFAGKGLSEVAQLYHPDMDTIKFLKFFFYLTDVETTTGPHCLIEGTHKSKPKEVRDVRRYTDEELLQHYSKDRFKEFTGKKGTILAVDTRGFHKGKPVEEKERLLFQIEYDNTNFGFNNMKVKLNDQVKEKYKTVLTKYSKTFTNIFTKQ